MVSSINTNSGAMQALTSLAVSSQNLNVSQKRVSTGNRVADANDNGAAFAIAQNIRGDINAYDSVQSQLMSATGLTAVTSAAQEQVSNVFNDLQATTVKLADNSLSSQERAIYTEQFNQQIQQAQSFVQNANFNGQNILKTGAADVNVIANQEGGQITVAAQDLEAVITSIGGAPADAAAASALLAPGGALQTARNTLATQSSETAATTRQLGNQVRFTSTLRDASDVGLGAIVDADLARESAKLQANQVRQQLATQSLGIANQSPQVLMGLFRGN